MAEIDAATLTKADAVNLVTSEMDRQIANFKRIMAQLSTKMKRKSTALNAEAPHDILNAIISEIEVRTIARFAQLTQSAIERAPRNFSQKWQLKHLCQRKTLEMWKLGTRADSEMKSKVAGHFPQYQYERRTMPVDTHALDSYFQRKPVSWVSWQPSNKAATITRIMDEYFSNVDSLIREFKSNYEATKSRMARHIENMERHYEEHGIRGQSISVQSYQDNIEYPKFDIDSAELESQARNSVEECLRQTRHCTDTDPCFTDVKRVIEMLKTNAILMDQSSNDVIFELFTLQ